MLVLTNTQPIMAFLRILNDYAFKGALSAAGKVPLSWEQYLQGAEATWPQSGCYPLQSRAVRIRTHRMPIGEEGKPDEKVVLH